MSELFPDLFGKEIGTRTKMSVTLRVKSNTLPVHCRARPVALAVQEPLNAELNRLVANGTLTPVESSEWAA